MMDVCDFAAQPFWINVATLCSLRELLHLRQTCKYLNELLSCNSVWRVHWLRLCSRYDFHQWKQMVELENCPHTPGMYENLCYRLVAYRSSREHPQQWFVMNTKGDIEAFNITKNLTSFSFFDSTQLRQKAKASWSIRLRSAVSPVIPVRRTDTHTTSFLDAVTDHMLLGHTLDHQSPSELWPLLETEKKAFYKHRIALLLRKRRNVKENCLMQRPAMTCGMPQQFCSLNLLGSGWKLQKRRLAALESEADLSGRFKVMASYPLQCSVQEFLRPGLIRDYKMQRNEVCLRAPCEILPQDLEKLQDLFFRILGYSCLRPFNVAYHVSDKAQAETCLVIESYSYHTVITPVVDGVICSDMVRCKAIGFSHVLDYLVLSLTVTNPFLNSVRASSLMLSTNPERMTLALSSWRDLRAAFRPGNPAEYAYNSQLGVLHTGTAHQLNNSILCVFCGIDSCDRSDFLVLLATEYMYKCLDLVSMVTELLAQFDVVSLRRLVSHIFFVGENTRIGSFRERFERDLRARLDRLAAVLGGEFARQQRWPIHCVHADVQEEEAEKWPHSEKIMATDYILHGPNYL